jgi:hypothetical protein
MNEIMNERSKERKKEKKKERKKEKKERKERKKGRKNERKKEKKKKEKWKKIKTEREKERERERTLEYSKGRRTKYLYSRQLGLQTTYGDMSVWPVQGNPNLWDCRFVGLIKPISHTGVYINHEPRDSSQQQVFISC